MQDARSLPHRAFADACTLHSVSLEAQGHCPGTRCVTAASLRTFGSSTSDDREASSLVPAPDAASQALPDSAGAQSVLELASGGATDPVLGALEGAWPNVALAARLLDALHGATGLPWWATLSLTAAGAHPAFMQASAPCTCAARAAAAPFAAFHAPQLSFAAVRVGARNWA